MGSFLLQGAGGRMHSETHRSVYTLSSRLEYLQRRRDTFSLSSLLVERYYILAKETNSCGVTLLTGGYRFLMKAPDASLINVTRKE
jgi:hypothetical protein